MNWKETASAIVEKIRVYREFKDDWKVAKKTKDVTVWCRASPDWNGALYKAEAEIEAEPAMVFHYIDPSPNGPRGKWDTAVKELQVVEKVDDDLSVVRTITHPALYGVVSSRDFIDLVINTETNEFIATHAQNVPHPDMPEMSGFVRGFNYPCAIICTKFKDNPNKTLVSSYIQTDLGGMLPKAIVENALPSNMANFFGSLRKALQDDGHWKGVMNGES